MSRLFVLLTTLLVTAGPAAADPDCYFGLPHTTLGSATLGTDPAGRLLISNLGSTGLDGVEIDLGKTSGFAMQFDPGPAGALLDDTLVRVTYTQLEDFVRVEMLETDGGQATLSLAAGGEFTPQCVRVELRLGETVVDSREYSFQTLLTNPVIVTGGFGSGPGGAPMTIQASRGPGDLAVFVFQPEPIAAAASNSPTGSVQCDTVVMLLDGLPPGEPVRRDVGLGFEGANCPGGSLIVEGEYLESRWPCALLNPVIATLGDATMSGLADHWLCDPCPECWYPPDPDLLEFQSGAQVSNIGASGLDGVRFQCREWGSPWFFSDFQVRTDGIRLLPGGALTLEATGVYGGAAGQALGTCAVHEDGSGVGAYELRADYTALGSSEVTVEVYDDGLLSGSFVTTGGPGVVLATITPNGPTLGWNKCGKLGGVGITPCYVMCADAFFTVDDGTGVPLAGNEMRVLATGATDAVGTVDTLALRCRDTEDFIVAWEASPASVPVQVPYSGQIAHGGDGADLEVADFDGDGVDDLIVSLDGRGTVVTGLRASEGGGYGGTIDTGQLERLQFDIYDDQCPTCPNGEIAGFEIEPGGLPGQSTFRRRGHDLTGHVTLYKSPTEPAGDFDEDEHDLAIEVQVGGSLIVTGADGTARAAGGGAMDVTVRCAVASDAGTGVTVSHPVHGAFADVTEIVVTYTVPVADFGAIDRMCLDATPSPACVSCGFVLNEIRLAQFGHDHVGTGQARLIAMSCDDDSDGDEIDQALAIENLGHTGLDGVDVRIPPAPKHARVGLCCFGSDPDDLCIVVIGRAAGGGSGPLASSGMAVSGPGTRALSAAFPAAGPGYTITLEMRDAFGNVVATGGGLSEGVIATILGPGQPAAFETQADEGGFVVVWEFPADVEVDALSSSYVCRKLEARVSSAPFGDPAPPALEGLDLRVTAPAGGTTSLRIEDETTTEATAPCPGDTNGDGMVSVDDLNNVILDWGTDGSANGGDITGALPGSPPDAVVDVNDLNAVFVNWGICG